MHRSPAIDKQSSNRDNGLHEGDAVVWRQRHRRHRCRLRLLLRRRYRCVRHRKAVAAWDQRGAAAALRLAVGGSGHQSCPRSQWDPAAALRDVVGGAGRPSCGPCECAAASLVSRRVSAAVIDRGAATSNGIGSSLLFGMCDLKHATMSAGIHPGSYACSCGIQAATSALRQVPHNQLARCRQDLRGGECTGPTTRRARGPNQQLRRPPR